MRLSDVILESEKLSELDINAASASTPSDTPQGVVSKIKTGLSRISPFNPNQRARAKGISEIGKEANALMKDFQTYVGRTGSQQPTLNVLLDWMKSNQLPLTGGVAKLVQDVKTKASQPANQRKDPTLDPQNTPSAHAASLNDPNAHPADDNPNIHLSTNEDDANGQQDIPLDNKTVSQIISASIAEKNKVAATQQASQTNTSSQPQANPANQGTDDAGTGNIVGGSAPAQKTIDQNSIVNYYKNLQTDNDRKKLRAQLDQADAELAKARQTQSVDPVNEHVGYSRFLGMSL